MKGVSSILNTKVLCFNEKNEELYGKSEDLWIDCVIDLKEIKAIKKDIRDDGTEQTAVYFNGSDYFVIELNYNDAVNLWKVVNEKILY